MAGWNGDGDAVVEPELGVTVESARAGQWPVVRVSGEIDIQTSPILEEHLVAAADGGLTSVVVDLAEVTFLDSTGLSVLIGGLKRCQEAGGEMRLAGLRPNVRKVLEVTGLTEAFHVDEAGPGGD